MSYNNFKNEVDIIELNNCAERIVDKKEIERLIKIIEEDGEIPDNIEYESDEEGNYTFYDTDNLSDELVKQKIDLLNAKSLKKISDVLSFFKSLTIISLLMIAFLVVLLLTRKI